MLRVLQDTPERLVLLDLMSPMDACCGLVLAGGGAWLAAGGWWAVAWPAWALAAAFFLGWGLFRVVGVERATGRVTLVSHWLVVPTVRRWARDELREVIFYQHGSNLHELQLRHVTDREPPLLASLALYDPDWEDLPRLFTVGLEFAGVGGWQPRGPIMRGVALGQRLAEAIGVPFRQVRL